MAMMFVGNVRKQHHVFHYRVSGRTNLTSQEIPIGQQIKLSGDLTPDDIEGVILQHQQYGFCDANNDIPKKFGGILYSIGKPISEDKLRKAMIKFQQQMVEMGQEIRKQAAVSVSSQIDSEIVGVDNPNMKLTNLEMSVEEVPKATGLAEGQELFNEGLQIFKGPKAS
jgi:hypothetical protein